MKPPPEGEAAALAELRGRIGAEIVAGGGVIPFARFMERALYEPELGYYERGRQVVGKRGDFYTSVSVGPLFGELLAFQFADWLAALPEFNSRFRRLNLIEGGAHDASLARDILTALTRFHPAVAARVDYWIIEPSFTRRAWQRETLKEFQGRTFWINSVKGLADVRGVILGNELLDAFPVHRLGWDAPRRRWFEWGVKQLGERFAWIPLADIGAGVPVPELPDELLAVLPDGFSTEVCPAATAWWRDVAKKLKSGWLCTADYGLEAAEFFFPHRANGTLRAYAGHRLADDVLANPGAQDLTAHVNFTALKQTGAAAGLTTAAHASQRNFLTGIFAATQRPGAAFPQWDATRVRQFQTLTHPEHLGRAFSALVQRRA